MCIAWYNLNLGYQSQEKHWKILYKEHEPRAKLDQVINEFNIEKYYL